MKESFVIVLCVIIFASSIYIGANIIENNILLSIKETVTTDSGSIVVLDAGHGGEDGGAVAFDGTIEKNLNLEITNCISLFFDLFGINYVKIRHTDISVGDTTLETVRERKVSDIHKRLSIINSYPNSILLSIHQNKFNVEKYSGTQVFYSTNDDNSVLIAESIQNNVRSYLQPENTRKIMASSDDIYLLHKATRPSVLVECGFMSNPNELAKLKETSYQTQMAYVITKGLINYFNNSKGV